MKPAQVTIYVFVPSEILGLGFKSLFESYFNLHTVSVLTSVDKIAELNIAAKELQLIMVHSELFILNPAFFTSSRNRKVVLLAETNSEQTTNGFITWSLKTPIPELVDRIEQLLGNWMPTTENETETLSDREKEVLQWVVKGFQNKEIADKLNISLHTVISHRKNITGKVGIKTVSGLTVYALLNGLLRMDEIQ